MTAATLAERPPVARATLSLDAIDRITPDDFYCEHIRRNKPVLMRRMMDDWPAMQKWSFDFFSNLSADEPVHLEEGNVMQESTGFRKTSFREFMQRLMADEPATPTERKLYLSVFNILAAFPQLTGDVDFSILNRFKVKHTVAGWIGPEGTVTGFHIDWGDNILAQVCGRKELHLVAPSQSGFMYPSKKFDQGTLISEVDLDRPDLERHPLFSRVTPYKFTLNPGEMVFIPRGWWHHVRSLDRSISVSNLSFDAKGIFRDALPQRFKQILHNAGLFRGECTCHVWQDGKRIRK